MSAVLILEMIFSLEAATVGSVESDATPGMRGKTGEGFSEFAAVSVELRVSLRGETTSVDELTARNNSQSLFTNIPITNLVDYNRDGVVNSVDQLLARNNAQTAGATRYINFGAGGPFAPLPPSGNSGVASALASTSSCPNHSLPPLPAWVVNRLNHGDLNFGPFAKYLEHLAEEDAAKSREILVEVDQVADALHLDDTPLESLLVQLGFE